MCVSKTNWFKREEFKAVSTQLVEIFHAQVIITIFLNCATKGIYRKLLDLIQCNKWVKARSRATSNNHYLFDKN